MSHFCIPLAALGAALCCVGPAAASVAIYDIRGTISGSPLDGQDFGGHFSLDYDDSTPLGVQLPLLDLVFRFNGVTYDETDFATAAVLRGDGETLRTLFGTACAFRTAPFPGIACELPSAGDGWFFSGSSNGNGGLSFVFANSGGEFFADATVTQRDTNPVPEPSSAALVVAALAGAAFVRRRRSEACHRKTVAPR
jgi:hypothetical protein